MSISFSIHFAAYVVSWQPFSGSNVSMPLISPILPTLIRSSASPALLYFFTMCATRRRLCFTRISYASRSPFLYMAKYSRSFSGLNGFGNEPLLFTNDVKKNILDKNAIKVSKIIKRLDFWFENVACFDGHDRFVGCGLICIWRSMSNFACPQKYSRA